MQIILKNNLIFTQVSIVYQGAATDISSVLVDTGSATTILAADEVARVQIKAVPQDTIHIIRGVGGVESVFTRFVDDLIVGECNLPHFQIEVGKMAYGFEINGILGMDFLIRAKAIINLPEMRIDFI
jgi:hypothetical protein